MQITLTGSSLGYLSRAHTLDYISLLSYIVTTSQVCCSDTPCVPTCWHGWEDCMGWAQGNISSGWIKHLVLLWQCPCQAWQRQPLPASSSSLCTPAEGNPLPPTWCHLPQMASAKPTEAVALFHWHSFMCMRGFARIISLARRGWLLL